MRGSDWMVVAVHLLGACKQLPVERVATGSGGGTGGIGQGATESQAPSRASDRADTRDSSDRPLVSLADAGDVAASTSVVASEVISWRTVEAEARRNIASIYVGGLNWLRTTDEQGHPTWPVTAPRTPQDVPRGTTVVDPPGTWNAGGWRNVNFEISQPHRCSYEMITTGLQLQVRAYCDSDGDGVLAVFEKRAVIESGEVVSGSTSVTNPGE